MLASLASAAGWPPSRPPYRVVLLPLPVPLCNCSKRTLGFIALLCLLLLYALWGSLGQWGDFRDAPRARVHVSLAVQRGDARTEAQRQADTWVMLSQGAATPRVVRSSPRASSPAAAADGGTGVVSSASLRSACEGAEPSLVLLTAASASSFPLVENLIGSVHRWVPHRCTIVYDVGMDELQRASVRRMWRVQLVEREQWAQQSASIVRQHTDDKAAAGDADASTLASVPANIPPHVLDASSLAYEPLVTLHALLHLRVHRVLFLDPGLELSGRRSGLRSLLQRQGYAFIAQQDESGSDGGVDPARVQQGTLDALGVKGEEARGSRMCVGGVQGYVGVLEQEVAYTDSYLKAQVGVDESADYSEEFLNTFLASRPLPPIPASALSDAISLVLLPAARCALRADCIVPTGDGATSRRTQRAHADSILSILVDQAGLEVEEGVRLGGQDETELASGPQDLSELDRPQYTLFDRRSTLARSTDSDSSDSDDALQLLPYVDLAIKRTQLAVVVPFIARQVPQLREMLQRWNETPPCELGTDGASGHAAGTGTGAGADGETATDLVFYFNASRNETLEAELRALFDEDSASDGGTARSSSAKRRRSKLRSSASPASSSPPRFPWRGCFRHLHLLYAQVPPELDVYPSGPGVAFAHLFDHPDASLLRREYSHFMLLEPDTLPVRTGWLSQIIGRGGEIEGRNPRWMREAMGDGWKDAQLRASGVTMFSPYTPSSSSTGSSSRSSGYSVSDWWIAGSAYRGTRLFGAYSAHINGNALYHLSSSYRSFLRRVREFYPTLPQGEEEQPGRYSMAFDVDQWVYLWGTPREVLENRGRHWHHRQSLAGALGHKFLLTDFVQNCCLDGCGPAATLRRNNPNTFLVHQLERRTMQPEASAFARFIQGPLGVVVCVATLALLGAAVVYGRRWWAARQMQLHVDSVYGEARPKFVSV